MHVILKPFIKLIVMVIAVLGIAEIAGVDVEELVQKLLGMISGEEGDTEETTEVAE